MQSSPRTYSKSTPVPENFEQQKPAKGSVLLSPIDQDVHDEWSLGGIPLEVDTTGVSIPDSIGLSPSKHKTYKGGKK